MTIEKFTDDEKRLFLAAMERERQVCENTDLYNSLMSLMLKDTLPIKILQTTDICDSIKNKVINSVLWS